MELQINVTQSLCFLNHARNFQAFFVNDSYENTATNSNRRSYRPSVLQMGHASKLLVDSKAPV